MTRKRYGRFFLLLCLKLYLFLVYMGCTFQIMPNPHFSVILIIKSDFVVKLSVDLALITHVLDLLSTLFKITASRT